MQPEAEGVEVKTTHAFRQMRPYDRGFLWGRRNSRCIHCHIDEDHAVNDYCAVLIERLRSMLRESVS